MRSSVLSSTFLVAALAIAACGSESDETSDDGSTPAPTTPAEANDTTEGVDDTDDVQRYPDVIDATATRDGDTWTIAATLSSPYDTPERYADAWRVVGPDGTVYGERILTHDHANEQPFTRSQSGIEIPDDVNEVVIEGRDLEFGYGGATVVLTLPS